MKKLLGILLLASLICLMLASFAFAQDNNATVTDNGVENGVLPTEGQTILYAVGAWLLYSMLGLVASITTVTVGEDGKPTPVVFDKDKLLKSLLYAIVVAALALLGNIQPVTIEAEYSNLVTEIVHFVMNLGLFATPIYALNKVVTIITNITSKQKAVSP